MIPKPLRDRLGLRAGEVEAFADGAGLRIEPIAGEGFDELDGRFVIPATGTMLRDEDVQVLRDADQR